MFVFMYTLYLFTCCTHYRSTSRLHFFLLLFWGKGIVLSIRIYMVRISTEPFAVENFDLESVRITTQSKYSWNT